MGPPYCIPLDRLNAQLGDVDLFGIVGMVDELIGARFILIDAIVTWPAPAIVLAEDERAAPFQHRNTGLIDIGAGDR